MNISKIKMFWVFDLNKTGFISTDSIVVFKEDIRRNKILNISKIKMVKSMLNYSASQQYFEVDQDYANRKFCLTCIYLIVMLKLVGSLKIQIFTLNWIILIENRFLHICLHFETWRTHLLKYDVIQKSWSLSCYLWK